MEKAPNDKFREARERTQSPANSEYCLSRQELADRANAWIWKNHGKKYEINASYVGKLEQGVIRWPNALTRETFRTILGVSKDSELGFINARARYYRAVVKLSDVDNVKRRKLFENATALGMSGLILEEPMVAVLEGIEPTPIPRRVGASDIAQIRDATQMFSSLSSTYGGGVVREVAMAQLRYSGGLLDESICPERLRPELLSAVGDLAEVAGFIAMDAGVQAEARRVLGFGLWCAEQAKDWSLRAEILSNMSAQAVSTGQPDEGLTLAELALVRADRLTPAGRALLHTDRALALAKMRRVQEALRAVGTADGHFGHATPDTEPSSMAFYTDAHHALYTGRPLVDLAIVGRDPGEATTRLIAAVGGYPESKTRSRAMCLTKLASLTMATGDPLQAATIGHQALEVAGTLRSCRSAEELRELFRYAAAHQDLGEVADLRQRIATLVCTENP